MAAVAHLAAHPELPRPTLRIGFTPDEEIGQGATLFDVERFGARCAYTMDGSTLGELQDETFTGAEAIVTIHGVDVHPGFATGKLVNAARLAGADARRPARRTLTPETHLGPRGLHPRLRGRRPPPARRSSALIVRDFDDDLLDAPRRAAARDRRGGRRHRAAGAARDRGRASSTRTCAATSSPSRRSSRRPSRRSAPRGIEPLRTPIRGGTDGSMPQRDGPADAEPLHRRPRVPLGARVGLGAGHGGRGGDGRAPGRGVGPALACAHRVRPSPARALPRVRSAGRRLQRALLLVLRRRADRDVAGGLRLLRQRRAGRHRRRRGRGGGHLPRAGALRRRGRRRAAPSSASAPRR